MKSNRTTPPVSPKLPWYTAITQAENIAEIMVDIKEHQMDEQDRLARITALSEAIRSSTNDVKPSDIISRAQTFYEFLVRPAAPQVLRQPAVKKTRKKK